MKVEAVLFVEWAQRRHAIEAEVGRAGQEARAEGLHGVGPQRATDALLAQVGPHNEQPEEAEAGIVGNYRSNTDDLAAAFDNEEAIGIGRPKGVGVVEAGVPALFGGPVEREVKLGAGHGAELEVGHGEVF